METLNRCMVGLIGDEIVVMRPQARFTRAEALNLAAWLVALAEENEGEFQAVLDAVRET